MQTVLYSQPRDAAEHCTGRKGNVICLFFSKQLTTDFNFFACVGYGWVGLYNPSGTKSQGHRSWSEVKQNVCAT